MLLGACGFHPVIGVEVLRQKALIVILEDGRFDMHDLVQEMGYYIVREKHPYNPEKHSRVWKSEDVHTILSMDARMKLDNIEAINLPSLNYEEFQRFLQVCGNMNKLRWVDLSCYEQNNKQRDETTLPLPENFPPGEICYLKIWCGISLQQLWEGYKGLPNLAHMDLDNMPNLIKIPDFAGLSNLKTFKLRYCPCLEEIHPSIGRLERLVFIYFDDCPQIQQQDNSGKEVASCKEPSTNVFISCWTCGCSSPPRYNLNHRRLRFLHTALRKLDLRFCCLRDENISSDFWELPNLEEFILCHNPYISRLDFSILRFPRLKWLNVSYSRGLVKLSELPSSIAVVLADHCHSFESFGDISNCKWLWKLSLEGENKLGQLHGDTLIQSMLQGNAIEDHFISVALRQHPFPNRFAGRLYRGNTFTVHLPDDWYSDFSGFLICIVTDAYCPSINITIKQEDPPLDISHESDESMEPTYHEGSMTCVGYVSFSSLRHTTFFTSSYNTISFMVDTKSLENTYVGGELIPRKSESDEVQTADCSEFWDKKFQVEEFNTFTIQQCDSDSSIQISWKPVYDGPL